MITVHEWEHVDNSEACRYCGTPKPADAWPSGPPRYLRESR